jgi:DNA polymerase III subunit gamma/tau
MSPPSENPELAEAPGGGRHPYVVVARRYRPQTFDELIGQEHVAQALSNAIATHRVGHAYLFTGARGVGKTSAARILAKALNCQQGPTSKPCNQCDVCQSVSGGEDVDVLEIDGASNRGIDEIRQLRQNAGVRPSRSRFKIYIIDEVHMLTREAFNALLKTLEEPPEHVKFIFCTTEPTKIPITILSRCQRFDFAGILTRSIQRRLEQIVAAEGLEAEPEALDILARRAAGSMRDSQSLLEQLLAFSPGRITVAEVHAMLGTAGEERLASLVQHLIGQNAAGALAELDTALNAGVDAALLIEQLFGSLRDCMVAAVGCPGEAFLYTSSSGAEAVTTAGKQLGLSTLLAIMQILDQTLSRMRYSTQGRILAELALVRICQLENLDELSELIAQLRSGAAVEGVPGTTGTSPGIKKKYEPATCEPVVARSAGVPPATGNEGTSGGRDARAPHEARWGGSCTAAPGPAVQLPPQQTPQHTSGRDARAPVAELTSQNAVEVWNHALATLSGMVVEQAKQFDSATVPSPNRLVLWFKPSYAICKTACERPEQVARFEQALADVAGKRIRVEFALAADEPGEAVPSDSARAASPRQRQLDVMQNPLVHRATELFGAQVVDVVDPPPQEVASTGVPPALKE